MKVYPRARASAEEQFRARSRQPPETSRRGPAPGGPTASGGCPATDCGDKAGAHSPSLWPERRQFVEPRVALTAASESGVTSFSPAASAPPRNRLWYGIELRDGRAKRATTAESPTSIRVARRDNVYQGRAIDRARLQRCQKCATGFEQSQANEGEIHRILLRAEVDDRSHFETGRWPRRVLAEVSVPAAARGFALPSVLRCRGANQRCGRPRRVLVPG